MARIDAEKTRPSLFTQTQTPLVPPPVFETYSPFYIPSRPQQLVYNQFFGFSHLQHTPQPKPSSPKKSKSKVKISEPKSKDTSSSFVPSVPSEDSPKVTLKPPKKDKGPMDQTEPVPPIPPPTSDHSTKLSSASWFTFDDIPHHKWPAWLQEFAAWIDLQGTKPNAQPQAVLLEFMARSTSFLRD